MHSCCGRVFAEEASFDAHQTTVHPHPYRIEVRHAWEAEREIAAVIEFARQFNADQRKKAAKSGAAMSDGSFPIENVQDLRNAIKAVGRASNPAGAKAHIKKRAKALGRENLLPSDWATIGAGGIQGAPDVITDPQADQQGLPYSCNFCGRKFASETALDLHKSLVHANQLPGGQSQDGVSKKTGEYGVPSSKMTNDTSAVSAAENKKKNGQSIPSHLKNGSASNVNSSGGAGSGASSSPANTTGPNGEMAAKGGGGGNGNGNGGSSGNPNRDSTQPQKPASDPTSYWPWLVSDQADKPESFDDIRSIVQDALTDLQEQNGLTGDSVYIWIADISDTWVVFSRRGDYFKVNYSMDDSGAVTFSGPVQSVQRRTVYVPDPDSDEDNTEDSSAATGHKKLKDGKSQPSHFKDGHARYVMGFAGPGMPMDMDPDRDGDVDMPGMSGDTDNDTKS